MCVRVCVCVCVCVCKRWLRAHVTSSAGNSYLVVHCHRCPVNTTYFDHVYTGATSCPAQENTALMNGAWRILYNVRSPVSIGGDHVRASNQRTSAPGYLIIILRGTEGDSVNFHVQNARSVSFKYNVSWKKSFDLRGRRRESFRRIL